LVHQYFAKKQTFVIF